ncbi:hypothetical protein EMIHUDRAFT_69853 [Emiliania huxleyi CCMP1516]|uniref:Uncharacterized protein n=2 Tax=Emiliania huxleyi TaxID=2903 RepID=A0A0D3KW46_EMIH1|nr:hypothetical protein EMIHUDRAFT_69853 [Emiliania huxleyi CCMP1516]EOD39981.1 hypothetical protein EMIHUDRAFT_69853 [Emiliania huxleyi CCMP1516]|eukprot:XP_005792410.1 hypothetical protein EMIHUDRAFT_69853 [Emiliania huxleyi CCMP1516]
MAALHVAFCAVGIVVSYVLWGYMQERIMTQPYATGELFRSSKFLVFANRALALLVAYAAREAQRAQGACVSHTAPLYQFSFSSVSNILSSVSQYEALRYISFPTQALASRPGATALASRGGAAPLLSPPPRRWKSCKMVPVMVMGYFVSRKTYPAAEYAIADSWVVGIGVGVFLFKTYEVNEAPVRDTELLGVCFISAYMVCDSFTSNYQSRVFKQYSVGSITMMVYTNLFSTAFTALGLCLTWELADVAVGLPSPHRRDPWWRFSIHPRWPAAGQLFIFHTIKTYGPLVFATIQTAGQPSGGSKRRQAAD